MMKKKMMKNMQMLNLEELNEVDMESADKGGKKIYDEVNEYCEKWKTEP